MVAIWSRRWGRECFCKSPGPRGESFCKSHAAGVPTFCKSTLKTHLRLAQLASARRVVVEALIYAALIGLAVSRAIWRKLRALVDAGRRVSERRVTDALSAIATELAVALGGVAVSTEQLRRWHALLSAEGADPNVGRATMKRGWAC